MTFEHSSSSLGRQCQMASAENNTSGPVPQCSKDCLIAAVQARVGITIPPSYSNAEDN
ncbi:hypothetical protein Tco_1140949, partial [Tanacetum coccineum]